MSVGGDVSLRADAQRHHVLRADGMRSPGGGCQLIHMVFRETKQHAFETMAPPAATDSRITSQKTFEIIITTLEIINSSPRGEKSA